MLDIGGEMEYNSGRKGGIMRSQRYQTHYKVGTKNGKDVYWHPSEDYSAEEDHSYLVGLSSLDGVVIDPEGKIRLDIEASYGKLREAMTSELRAAFDDLEDKLLADYCKKEKDRLVECSNPSLVGESRQS